MGLTNVSACLAHHSPAVRERAVAAYLGLALGDALGATVEFMTPREIVVVHGVHDRIRGGGWLKLKPGEVTDDTTMSLALGRAILAEGRVDALAAARAFDDWMRAKPVDIGNTVRRGILSFRRTGYAAVPACDQDAGNGAAMRILPVALATLAQDEAAVGAACRAQAHVTHHNSLSDAACACLALMVRDALGGADRDALWQRRVLPLIDAFPQFAFHGRRRENPSGYVVETLQAVFQAVQATHGFRDCLVDVVNRGGDADTTGAIAGMLAGTLYGLEALPTDWLHALQPAVEQACRSQAADLLELPRSAPRRADGGNGVPCVANTR